MNVGDLITRAMREQRTRDLNRLRRWVLRNRPSNDYHAFDAWLMWGWDLNGPGGLGVPGATFPSPA